MAVLSVPVQAPERPPVSTSVTNDIPPLTGLRGFAALYVVVFHYFGLSFTNPFNTFVAHGYLAVDLFFVLSGFVMALNYRHLFADGWTKASYGKFLGRRIARVYPLYVVATIAAFVLVLLGHLWSDHRVPMVLLLGLNVAMVQTWGLVTSLDGPAWSISAEWAAYLIFPALLVPALYRRPAWGWVSACLCVAVIALLSILPASIAPDRSQPQALLDIHSPAFALPVIRGVVEFVLGLLAFRIASGSFGLKLRTSRWIAPVLSFAIFALLMIPRTDLFVVLLLPLLVVALSSQEHAAGRILSSWPALRLGVLSYSIYLVHDLLGGMLDWVHTMVRNAGIAHGQTVAAFIGIALTIGIASVTYEKIEAPGRRWLRYILEGGRIPAPRRLRPEAR